MLHASLQVWDNAIPGAKDLGPMTVIPESHPVTQPLAQPHRYKDSEADRTWPSCSITADCTTSASSPAAESGHTMPPAPSKSGITPYANAVAAPSMQIRVTSKSQATGDIPRQAMLDQAVSCDQQSPKADPSAEGTPTEEDQMTAAQSSLIRPHDASEAEQSLSSCAASCQPAADADLHQAIYAPLHSYSQDLQHEHALTEGAWRGTGSPLPRRAFLEAPSVQPSNHASADSAFDCAVSTSLLCTTVASCSNAPAHVDSIHVVADTAVGRGVSLLPGKHQAQQMPSAESQGQSCAAPGPPCATGGRFQHKLAALGRGREEEEQSSACFAEQSAERQGLENTGRVACVDAEWCEIPVSSHWWDNIAKKDVIGMRELQRWESRHHAPLNCCSAQLLLLAQEAPCLSDTVQSIGSVMLQCKRSPCLVPTTASSLHATLHSMQNVVHWMQIDCQ